VTRCATPCRAFLEVESAVPAIIQALSHEEYRVSIACLSTLCNLSADKYVVSRFVAEPQLLAALERVLNQKRLDPDPQANATQLMLNLCAPFCVPPRGGGDGGDDDGFGAAELGVTCHTSNSALAGASASGAVADERAGAIGGMRDLDGSFLTQSATSMSCNGATKLTVHSDRTNTNPATTRDSARTRTTLAALDSPDATKAARARPPLPPPPDSRDLLSLTLRVLEHAPALDKEARENCIEVVLTLLQLPDSVTGVNSVVRPSSLLRSVSCTTTWHL
jgi:hypothetical protein